MKEAKTVDFISKQRTHAENLKLGRPTYYCEVNAKGEYHSGMRASDAAKHPPMVMNFAFPVGKKAGVVKPGQE